MINIQLTHKKMSQDELELFSGLSSDAFVIIDFAGNLLYSNAAYAKTLGYDPDELAYKTCLETIVTFVHPDDLKRTLQAIELVQQRNTLQDFENRHKCKDNSYKWFCWTSVARHENQRIYWVGRDITAKKDIEIDLKLSEDRFTKVFRSSPHMVSIIRLADQRYIEVNPRFLQVKELTREAVIGKTPLELGAPEEELNTILNQLETCGSITNFEATSPNKHGAPGRLLLSAELIELNGEKCALFAYNDISELRKAQAEVAHLERLKLVGQMAAGIGHEIRNPMTTVRGYLQLMQNKVQHTEKQAVFSLMIDELDRANSIISEFLSVARKSISNGKLQSLNLLLQNLYPLLEADAVNQDKQLVLLTGEIPYLFLDTQEVTQLILNLCRNGFEAMDTAGCLTIRTFCDGSDVVMSVHDQGHGISQENMDKLGTPFFTTKETGTGLGLTSCYAIATRNNARIEVETCSDGTTFRVRFSQAPSQSKTHQTYQSTSSK